MRVLHYASRSLAAMALVALAAGCSSDSTAPDAPFDPAGTAADVSAINESFDSPALEAYASASGNISAVVGGSVALAVQAAPSAAIARNGRAGALTYAASLAKGYTARGMRPSLSAASIPAEYLGVTFEYDVETDGYVASDLPGAPSNGVRFLLYAVNPVTSLPVEPLVEVGYANIIATETTSSATVQVIVVSGGVTYLDYTVAASAGTSSVNLSITGYATNGTDRVNFNLQNRLTGTEEDGFSIIIDYQMVVPTRGGFLMEIEATTTGIFTESTSTILELLARGDHGTVSIEGTETNGAGSFAVEVNGDLFATITITGDAVPTIVGADGQPLSDSDLEAFASVWAMFGDGFDFFEDLTDPLT